MMIEFRKMQNLVSKLFGHFQINQLEISTKAINIYVETNLLSYLSYVQYNLFLIFLALSIAVSTSILKVSSFKSHFINNSAYSK